MSRTTKHEKAALDRDSAELRLARLLDAPFLARLVPHLPPETLHQLIQYRGLEACGELVASATPAQLTSLLDLDLWRRARPARDEQFDVDRFGEWLEVLVDTGDAVAARTVAALDQHLVITGLSHYLRVFDPGTFEPTASSDDEAVDRREMMNSETSGDGPEYEVGGYLVRARRTDAWDAIVTLLVTLEADHNHCFHAVMQGCRRLSNSRPEIDGLDDLLTAPEQDLHDVAVEREQRRSRDGYATAADARAFIQMARHPRTTPPAAANPIVTAYFRAVEESGDTRQEKSAASESVPDDDATDVLARGNDGIATSIDAVIDLLAEASGLRPDFAVPASPRALPGSADEDPRAARLPLLKRLMAFALRHDEAAYLARSRELAFLANTLLAGSSVQSRPLTPREASDAASCTCNLGLECWSAPWAPSLSRGEPPDAFLVDHDLVAAFEAGWSVLYRDVSLFVADRLITILTDLRCADADTRRGLRILHRTLERHRQAGTPWLARDAADVLAALDMTAWIGVLGLLDECPILPAALTAVLEHRTTPVSPTDFEFISTVAQIEDIRRFMTALPGILSS